MYAPAGADSVTFRGVSISFGDLVVLMIKIAIPQSRPGLSSLDGPSSRAGGPSLRPYDEGAPDPAAPLRASSLVDVPTWSDVDHPNLLLGLDIEDPVRSSDAD
jgi:hypothetical protein